MSHPILTIMVDKTLVGYDMAEELYMKYTEAAEKHNKNVNNGDHPDAGFDLFVLQHLVSEIKHLGQFKVNHGIRCFMMPSPATRKKQSEAYYLYPRSSISKSSYRLANSVGIIDSGYRGEIIGVFDRLLYVAQGSPLPNNYDRLCQICARNLEPFLVKVKIIDSYAVEDIVGETRRGEGGFGSTGR